MELPTIQIYPGRAPHKDAYRPGSCCRCSGPLEHRKYHPAYFNHQDGDAAEEQREEFECRACDLVYDVADGLWVEL